MLPNYFDGIFVHLRRKVRLRPELSPKFLSTLSPNPTQKARADLKPCIVKCGYLQGSAPLLATVV